MNNKNLSHLFSTPLWSFQAENITDTNSKLTNAVLNEKKQSSGTSFSNQGGWQSRGDLQEHPDFKILVDIINSHLIEVGNDYGFGSDSAKLSVTSMWANVNSKDNNNTIHSHQSPSGKPCPIVLSGCYYVKVPMNSGELVLQDFYRPLRYLMLPFQTSNLMNSFTIKLAPREGNLLLFPAWLEHSVDSNQSNSDRISIAFNIALVNRPALSK